MKKGIKITLIVVPIILVIVASSFVGTLLYTKNNVTYNVGEATVTSYIAEIVIILPPSIDYEGFIVTETPFELINAGLYNIKDFQISLKVYGQGFAITALNGILLGQGENIIGDIAKGDTWSGALEINMTSNIAVLAIQDGEMRIEAEISLKIDFLIYKAPIIFNETQIEPWDSPF